MGLGHGKLYREDQQFVANVGLDQNPGKGFQGVCDVLPRLGQVRTRQLDSGYTVENYIPGRSL